MCSRDQNSYPTPSCNLKHQTSSFLSRIILTLTSYSGRVSITKGFQISKICGTKSIHYLKKMAVWNTSQKHSLSSEAQARSYTTNCFKKLSTLSRCADMRMSVLRSNLKLSLIPWDVNYSKLVSLNSDQKWQHITNARATYFKLGKWERRSAKKSKWSWSNALATIWAKLCQVSSDPNISFMKVTQWLGIRQPSQKCFSAYWQSVRMLITSRLLKN